MTLLRPCRLSSWLFSGLPGTPQRIYFAGNSLKYNKSCPAMAFIYIYILWCARAPTKMHHKATPTLLSLFRYPHLLKSRSGFGGLLKDLRVFLLFSPYGSSSSVSRRESGQTSLQSKTQKMCCFPLFWHCFERIWLSLMGVTFADNNPWGFQLALCLFPRFLNAIYF